MKRETIAIHGGFDSDPATKAVAVPIYQTAAYTFDSAAHGAALFNLEVEGFRYTRIANPTTSVLEERVAAYAANNQAPATNRDTDICDLDAGQIELHQPAVFSTVHIGRWLPRQRSLDQERWPGFASGAHSFTTASSWVAAH